MAGAPRLAGIVHVALTVTDVEASASWYERVLGLRRVADVPHDGGYGIVLSTPDEAVWLALHHHDANEGEGFAPTRTGLDHLALRLETYEELQRWRTWLSDQGVDVGEVIDLPDFDVAAAVFTDPDGIPLELISPRASW